MNFDFMPGKIRTCLSKLNTDKLYSIRLRIGFPVILIYSDKRLYLSNDGCSVLFNESVIVEEKDIEEIIRNVTENSIYAFNDNIKDGFVTTKDGLRIGIAGECVFDCGKIVTIKKFSSLNIRVPHEIDGCSKEIFDKIFRNKIENTLIVSPPFYGKTTILKDIAVKIDKTNNYSVLIIDERGEFVNVKGENIDVIRYSDKLYAFNYALRSLSPSIVITDELCTESDWECVENAKNSGVKIIASCHAEGVGDLTEKRYFIKNVFDKYAVLCGIGKLENIFDKSFNVV